MNPIEFWWADIKRQLRKLAIDTDPDLLQAIRRLRARLTDAKVAAWYSSDHRGTLTKAPSRASTFEARTTCCSSG